MKSLHLLVTLSTLYQVSYHHKIERIEKTYLGRVGKSYPTFSLCRKGGAGMRDFIRRIMIVALCVMLAVPIGVSATTVGTNDTDKLNSSGFDSESVGNTITLDNMNGMDSVIDTINNKSLELAHFNWLSSDSNTITVDGDSYSSLTTSEKKELMNVALGTIADASSADERNRNRLYNFIESQDEATAALTRALSENVHGDFATAMTWFQPFNGPINTVLGFLALIIMALVAISTLLDIAYLALPMFKMFCENVGQATPENPKFVSREAFMAVQEAEGQNKRTYLGCYLRNRSGMMFLLCICLAYLCSGQIYDLIGNFIDTISDIISVVKGA